ncbi:c-type cytochrome [Pararhizobium sp.]|uniref:c-type cytochrome n=1 Tax=Pararhizobium sp. TaxID=1977563 RepID=UPI0027284C5C|nr:c-type cytochrome [Pararhizobium sp.]MDO9418600.1 c-type cytochrome [Pararhizobium sp.]
MGMFKALSKAFLKRQFLVSHAAIAMVALLAVTQCPDVASARETFADDAYGTYKANVENGKYMFNASGCGACHGAGDNVELLSGGMEMETAIGKFFAPNISPHTNGIGGWTNAQFLNAVMNGLDKEGNNLYPVMPYTSYGGMKPEDVLDIKAYIDTLPQSDATNKENEISFPFSRQTTISWWKRNNFTVPAYQPVGDSQVERGRYLVENVGGCGDCHTPRTTTYGLDTDRAYEGEKGLTGAVAPDITKAKMSGVSAETFTAGFIEEGKKLSGSPIADPVMARFSRGLKILTEEDRNAMYAYLADREIKPVDKTVVVDDKASACKEATPEAAITGGDNAGLAQQADAFIGKYCRNCHGPGESAQGSYPAGDLSSISNNAAFVTPGDAAKSRLFTSVTSGRMPLGKRPSAEEVKSLEDWINSLSAEKVEAAAVTAKPERGRPMANYAQNLEAALKDVSQVEERDRPYVRYFSYRNQYNGMMSCEDDEAFQKRMAVLSGGFKKLLNSLSYGPKLVIPDEVEGTNGMLVRIDLRDLEWTEDDYNFLISEYFYGVDPQSDPTLAALAYQTKTLLPIMRIDWFMSNAAKPKFYNTLMKLPTDIKILEERFKVDVDKNIRDRRVIRAAFTDGSSGVSDHNRMLERHDMPFGGYYWKSYDFGGDVGKQVLQRFPHGPKEIAPLDAHLTPFEHDGGEMIFSLPNGLQGYYLSTAEGKQLDVGPTAIVSFRKRPIGKGVEVINARSCFDCHANGILSKRDQLREFIETSVLFSKDQQDVLLSMYVPQEELDETYKKDREHFVDALKQLGVTQPTPDGGAESMMAPGSAELVTYYADKYEDELDYEAMAAEFDMTTDEFAAAVKRIPPGELLHLAIDWSTILEAGGTVPRNELEEQYAYLLEPLMQLRPLDRAAYVQAAYDAAPAEKKAEYAAEAKPVYNAAQQVAATPEYRQEDAKNDGKVKLAIHVGSTTAKVNDQLSFELSSNQSCELQLFYVEENGNVEVFPDQIIGSTTLNANEKRVIPQPGSGTLTFDTPAASETMLAFCRAGGLGDYRMTADQARDLVKKSHQPVTRGLAIALTKKAEADNGASGVQMVTFEIKDY